MEWSTQGDVSYVPPARMQLVAARAVAEVVGDMIAEGGGDAASPTEVAGPREENLLQAARLLVDRRGLSLTIEEAPEDPDDPDQQVYLDGSLLPGPDAILAGPTFEDWLGAEVRGDAEPARS